MRRLVFQSRASRLPALQSTVCTSTRNGRTFESHSPPRGKLKPGRFPSMSLEDGLLNEKSILLGLSFIRRPDRSPVIRIHKARRGRQTCEHRYSIIISKPGSGRPEVLIWTADCRRFVLFTYFLPPAQRIPSNHFACTNKLLLCKLNAQKMDMSHAQHGELLEVCWLQHVGVPAFIGTPPPLTPLHAFACDIYGGSNHERNEQPEGNV
jgi:hypothetical protein